MRSLGDRDTQTAIPDAHGVGGRAPCNRSMHASSNAGGILYAILLFQISKLLPAYVLRLFHRWNQGEIQDMSNSAEPPGQLGPAVPLPRISETRCSGEHRIDGLQNLGRCPARERGPIVDFAERTQLDERRCSPAYFSSWFSKFASLAPASATRSRASLFA